MKVGLCVRQVEKSVQKNPTKLETFQSGNAQILQEKFVFREQTTWKA